MSAAPFPPSPAPLSAQASGMEHGTTPSAPRPEHFRAIYDALPDPAGITRVADGMYLEVNPAFCQLLGMSREQILGRTSTELSIWATNQERSKLVTTLQREGKVQNLPLNAQRNGELIPGQMSAQPVRIGDEDCMVFVFHDTSEETRIRNELLAKNAALDQAGRMAQLGYWVDERGKGLVFWSDVCYDIHGLPRGSALPKDYINTCVTPRWRDEMRRRIIDCLRHHTPWSMDVEIQRPDGTVIWGRARGEPVIENGRVLCIRGVMQDIDEQKRAEQRLRQSEERFSRIFQMLPYPMGISRRDDGVYLEVNPAWEAMFGYSRQEALGRSVTELGILGAQDRADLLVAAQSSQLLESYELQVTLRNGERRTCLQSMRATEFDGQPCWLFALQDITGRKHQEEEVREREALLSLTLSTAAVGRWDWNLHTGMISGDERWRSMHGLPAGTMKGPAFLWTEPLGPEEVLRVTTEVTRHVNQPETPFDTTFCIRRPHEKERWIRNLGKVVSLDTDGQPERMLGIALDVTAQHERENLLRRLAHYDTLTGLPNRVMLARKLADAMDQAHSMGALLGVAYLDLDGFKPVNDRLGHDAGDRLLVVAAQRMVRSLRPQDCVARLGGDEFAILLPKVQSVQECRQLLQQAMQSIASPYQLGKHRVGVTASIGYTLYPQDDADADTLLRHADQAMYAAKQAGRN
ncbi:MAG TPA: diguanylate cyclase, partial [Giesbergeria sp.]|nr:diguanylate cyclase [Giesbergeria sp.]